MKDKRHLQKYQNLKLNIGNVGEKREERVVKELEPLADLHGASGGDDYIAIEDYDENVDRKFVEDVLQPYLRELYRDL